jgi:hypothetical protein
MKFGIVVVICAPIQRMKPVPDDNLQLMRDFWSQFSQFSVSQEHIITHKLGVVSAREHRCQGIDEEIHFFASDIVVGRRSWEVKCI